MFIKHGGGRNPNHVRAFNPARISAADHVDDALKQLLATDDPRVFVAWCDGLASRDHFPRAANELQSIVTGTVPTYFLPGTETVVYRNGARKKVASEGSLIGVLWEGGLYQIYRVALIVRFVRSQITSERFTLDDLIAGLDSSKAANARRGLYCLGRVGRDEWTLDDPLPRDRRERAALALHFLIRAMATGK